jgi:hypothetical protein
MYKASPKKLHVPLVVRGADEVVPNLKVVYALYRVDHVLIWERVF